LAKNIRALGLDGKSRKLTRVRAERFVADGSHEWQGPRTIREKKVAASVSPVQNRVVFEPNFYFDYDYPGEGLGSLPGDHPLPYTYPLPYDILRHYQSSGMAVGEA
jgi:hypothetical protein